MTKRDHSQEGSQKAASQGKSGTQTERKAMQVPCEPPAAPSAELARLLTRMRGQALTARRDPTDPAAVVLVRGSERGSLGAGRAPRALIDEGLRLGEIRACAKGLYAPASAQDHSGAESAPDGPAALQPVHGQPEDGAAARFNEAESPLLWLYRRKGQDGQSLIDDAQYLAGERFRRDVTAAAMLPSVTTNWSRMESSSGQGAIRDPAFASDAAMAARQRVRAAFRLLGAEMGHFVLDVCGFLVPLQEAETRRAWPARSGKLVLRLALGRLADHYGLANVATGPRRAPLTSWQAGPERASMEAWLRTE